MYEPCASVHESLYRFCSPFLCVSDRMQAEEEVGISYELFLSIISLALNIRRTLYFYIDTLWYVEKLSQLFGQSPAGPPEDGLQCTNREVPSFTVYIQSICVLLQCTVPYLRCALHVYILLCCTHLLSVRALFFASRRSNKKWPLFAECNLDSFSINWSIPCGKKINETRISLYQQTRGVSKVELVYTPTSWSDISWISWGIPRRTHARI